MCVEVAVLYDQWCSECHLCSSTLGYQYVNPTLVLSDVHRALEALKVVQYMPTISAYAVLYRTMIMVFAQCDSPNTILQLSLIMGGHHLPYDVASATCVVKALVQQDAWRVGPEVIKGVVDCGGKQSCSILVQVLLGYAAAGDWLVVKHIVQVSDIITSLFRFCQVFYL